MEVLTVNTDFPSTPNSIDSDNEGINTPTTPIDFPLPKLLRIDSSSMQITPSPRSPTREVSSDLSVENINREFEFQKKENKLLENENKMKDLFLSEEKSKKNIFLYSFVGVGFLLSIVGIILIKYVRLKVSLVKSLKSEKENSISTKNQL